MRKIIKKYWDKNGWDFPSEKWALKLTLLLKDSLILLKDALEESKPFFLLPSITKEGQEFLNKKEIKDSLKHILNYLNKENISKIDQNKALEIVTKISKEQSIKKGVLMKSLRVAFFGCLNGPDLIQSWELFSENESDVKRIERCFISN